MIIDVLDNADRYLVLNKGFRSAFAFLMRSDLGELKPGRHEILNDRVYCIVEDATGRKREDAELEAHQRYIDIQLVLKGTDTMGWKRQPDCKDVTKPYNAEMDIEFYGDEPDAWIPVQEGMYAIFFPDDAHMPLISDGHLHKIIVKVAMDQ